MSENKRMVIGSEVNDDRKIELDLLGSKITLPVSIYDSAGGQVNLTQGLVTETFNGGTVTENSDNDVIIYTLNGTPVATVTINYTSSAKTSILNFAKT